MFDKKYKGTEPRLETVTIQIKECKYTQINILELYKAVEIYNIKNNNNISGILRFGYRTNLHMCSWI